MRSLGLVTLAITAVLVQATVEWQCVESPDSKPTLGIFCALISLPGSPIQTAAQRFLQSVANTLESDISLKLKRYPASVGYAYHLQRDTAAFFQSAGDDFARLQVDFLQRPYNTQITILDFSNWYDLAACYIREVRRATVLASNAKKDTKTPPRANLVANVQESCLTADFYRLAVPKILDSTGHPVNQSQPPDSIWNYASSLVPVKSETDVGGSTEGYDIAVAGSEGRTRTYTSDRPDGDARHFRSEEEAWSLISVLSDPTVAATLCRICLVSNLVPSARFRRFVPPLDEPRGICCASDQEVVVPIQFPLRSPVAENPWATLESPWGAAISPWDGTWGDSIDRHSNSEEHAHPYSAGSFLSQSSPPLHSAPLFRAVGEDDLSPPPEYMHWDFSSDVDVQHAVADLDGLNTAIVKWSAALKAVTSSKDILSMMREVFQLPGTDPLPQLLSIHEREGRLRMTSFSGHWIHRQDPLLKPYSDFVHAVVDDALDIFAKLKGIAPEMLADQRAARRVDGDVEFFYMQPSTQGLTGTDPRGVHVDDGLMQFVFSDVEGLVIQNEREGTFHRVKVGDDIFQLVKARNWEFDRWIRAENNAATPHAVFGQALSEQGRLSVVVSVYYRSFAIGT